MTWRRILSEVEQRLITNDYTFRHDSKFLQIVRRDIRPRMRLSHVRVEARRNGDTAVRFEDGYLQIVECQPAAKTAAASSVGKKAAKPKRPRGKSKWMDSFFKDPSPSLTKAITISNATS